MSRDRYRDAPTRGRCDQSVHRSSHEILERAISGHWRRRLLRWQRGRLEAAAPRRLCGRFDRHRPRGWERQLRARCEWTTELAHDPGQRLSRHPRDDGYREGARAGVLRQGAPLCLFQRLFDWRPSGIVRSATVPGRLRRHSVGCTRDQLAETSRRAVMGPRRHARGQELHPAV